MTQFKQGALLPQVTLACVESTEDFVDQKVKQVSRPTRYLCLEQLLPSLTLDIKQDESKLLQTRLLDLEIRASTHQYALYVHHIHRG